MSNFIPQSSGKKIMLLHPEDFRRDDLTVEQEYDVGFICKEFEDHQYRIRKLGQGWKGDKDTVWFTVEGVPMTNCIIEDHQDPLDIMEFLRFAWTDEVVDSLDNELITKLQTDFGVTVTIEPVEMPASLKITALKAYEYLQDHLRGVFGDFAAAEETKDWKENLMEKGIIFALGAFAMYFFIGMGII